MPGASGNMGTMPVGETDGVNSYVIIGLMPSQLVRTDDLRESFDSRDIQEIAISDGQARFSLGS